MEMKNERNAFLVSEGKGVCGKTVRVFLRIQSFYFPPAEENKKPERFSPFRFFIAVCFSITQQRR